MKTQKTPRSMNFKSYALASASAAGLAGTAVADFSSPYEVLNAGSQTGTSANGVNGDWSGLYTDFTAAKTTLTLNTSAAPGALTIGFSSNYDAVNGVGSDDFDSFDFTTTALADGDVSFDYNYSADGGSGQSKFAFVLNGSEALFEVSTTSGGFTIPVSAGNTFGFRLIDGSPYSGLTGVAGSTSVTITNFAAPIPEPSSLSMLAAGFVGLLGFREIRRRARTAA